MVVGQLLEIMVLLLLLLLWRMRNLAEVVKVQHQTRLLQE